PGLVLALDFGGICGGKLRQPARSGGSMTLTSATNVPARQVRSATQRTAACEGDEPSIATSSRGAVPDCERGRQMRTEHFASAAIFCETLPRKKRPTTERLGGPR